MKTFLIIYGILAFVFYVYILIISMKDVEETNKVFNRPVAHVSLIKLIGISLVFPLAIIYAVVSELIKTNSRKWV